MLRLSAYIKLVVALMLALVSSAYGQSPATAPGSQQKEVAVSESKPSKHENKADETKPKDLQTEVESLKTENAAVREQLRRMEEQQKAVLEQFERLQRRLEGATTGTPQAADEALPVANAPAATNSEN